MFKGMLWSTCAKGGSGAWPLFPWLALPLFFYHGAELIRKHISYFEKIQKYENVIWPILLSFSLYGLIIVYPGSLYNVHIGSKFYCQILNLKPLDFWSYFIWVMFFIRISVLKSLNIFLSNKRLCQLLQKLYWNSHFGLTYLCHIFFLYLGAQFDDVFYQEPFLFDFYVLGLFILPEFMARSLKMLLLLIKINK